jgi:bacterioferritin
LALKTTCRVIILAVRNVNKSQRGRTRSVRTGKAVVIGRLQHITTGEKHMAEGTLKGAEYMNIAAQLEQHAHQELEHALIISRQIDYLGKMPTVTAKPVKTSEKMRDMLKFDLDNENTTIINYRERIRQCEALGEFAMAEQIREILVQEQDHQIDLATALGEEVPDVSRLRKRKG